jgi:TRAP-type C4-dicarboxylate transport system permease small subunit
VQNFGFALLVLDIHKSFEITALCEVNSLRKILDVLRDSERKISQILLFLIIVLVFTASIFRTFGHPIVWSVDMAQLLFVWLCFLGADIALQHNCHIGVDILTRALPKKINTVIVFCSYLLILGFLVIIVIFGTYLALKKQSSPV